MNRSPNATKDEMQIAIDLLRARGDSCMEIIETTTLKVENLLSELNTLRAKLREVDDQLGIQPQHRKENAVLMARRLIGDAAKDKSDEEVLKMIGAYNERTPN